MTRVALIADIHGNRGALDAVLEDIRRRGVSRVFDLGDVAQGSLDPGGAIRRLREAGIPSIRGNADEPFLLDEPPAGEEEDHALARGSMDADDVAWLAAQPAFRREGELLLCHGTPASNTAYLLETIGPTGLGLATEAEILERLGTGPREALDGATLVAVAHSHVPRAVRLADGRTCVNPGSVGLPAWEHDTPVPHCTESGSPHARYAIVERRAGEWVVEHHILAYDWEAAAARARAAGRADRAHWLRTGRARPTAGRPGS